MSLDPLIARVQERLASGREPYAKLRERLFGRIKQDAKDEEECNDYENASKNANQAKALAFLYWATRDATQAQRAVSLLSKMRTDIPTGYFLQIAKGAKDILQMSETLTAYAQAYHFLQLADVSRLESPKKNLTELAQETGKLVKAILVYGQAFSKTLGIVTRHNYLLKGSSAVGLAGLYLDRPELVALGQKGVEAVRDVQGPQLERGWGEGADYFAYAAVNFLPFFIALNRHICTHGENFCGVKLQNYLADPIWKTAFLWYLKTRLPTGERPGVDDSRYTPFYSGLFATDPSTPEHATDHFEIPAAFWSWDWYHADLSVIREERWHTLGLVDLAADLLINFDDRIPRIEPTGDGFEPTQISRVCGQAVFRSGWNREALYFLLQGEEKKMAKTGGRHEHNDGTSFILCAFGELLALDCGYPGWPRREQTNQPQHHNRILIAKHEPEPTALLEHFFELPNLEGVQSSTWFSTLHGKRPRHERNVLFINKRFFVLDDYVCEAGGNEITFYLHGHGEATFSRPTLSNLAAPIASWQRPHARLHFYQTTSLGLPRVAHERGVHALGYLEAEDALLQHEVLQSQHSAEALRFLSVLYPQAAASAVELTMRSLKFGQSHGFHLTERKASGEKYHTLMLARTEAGGREHGATVWGEMRCEGKFVLLAGEKSPELMYCDGAREISFDNKIYFQAKHPFHGALEREESNGVIYGRQISATTTNQLKLYLGQPPVAVTGVRQLTFEKNTGLLHVEIASVTREFTICCSAIPFRKLALMTTTGIHPWQPYGDGEDYLHDGEGMLLQRSRATNHFFGYQRHALPIVPNTRYRLRCRVKTELQNGFVAAGLGEWSGKPETHHDFGFVSGAQDWQEISGEWLSPVDGKTIAVVLYGSENFQGRAWFKDAVLEVVDKALGFASEE